MNDLMRPALYDAKHQIIPIKKINKRIEMEILNLLAQFVKPLTNF